MACTRNNVFMLHILGPTYHLYIIHNNALLQMVHSNNIMATPSLNVLTKWFKNLVHRYIVAKMTGEKSISHATQYLVFEQVGWDDIHFA